MRGLKGPLALSLLLAASVALAAPRELPPPNSFEECDAWVRSDPDDLRSYRCFWILARQNKVAEAEARLRALLAVHPQNARARLFLARIEGDQGRDAAEPLYREAAAGLRKLEDAKGEILARLGLVLFFGRRGRLPDGDAEIAEARRIADASRDPMLHTWVRNEEGWQAFRKGDYASASRLFKEVEAAAFPDGPVDLRTNCLSGLGGVAQETGRIEESVQYTRRQAELCHEAGDYYDEARARGNLVLSGFRLAVSGRMESPEIATWAEDALRAAVAGGNRGTEGRARLYLGDLTAGTIAREHYSTGLAISEETKEVAGRILGLRGLAMSLAESEPRDLVEAQHLADRAVDLARGSRFWTAIAGLARARIEWLADDRPSAVAHSLAALDAIEAIRDVQDDAVIRARVFSMWAFAYHRLAGHLLRDAGRSRDDLDLAFAVIERMRARVLLDELDAAQASLRPAPSAATARRTKVLGQIASVQRRLMSPSLSRADRAGAVVELERLELEESRLRAEYLGADPAYAALRRPTLASLREVQEALHDDEAFVSFQVATRFNVDNRMTEDGSWVWAITRDSAKVVPIPDRERLRPAIAAFLGLIERRDGSEAGAAARLYDVLLREALLELPRGVSRLVIVPDGVLHRLPFEALRSDSRSPLVSRFAVTLAPSATLWLRWRKSKHPTSGLAALVLADPDVGEGAALDRAWAMPEGALPGHLPYARREGRAAGRALGRASQILEGAHATEAALKSAELRRFELVHFAAHALLDEEHPERSAIVLAPGSAEEDGLVQIREVVGLPLSDHLVVLSACRSASGTLLEGEGVMGLARAFFQAGARTVVGSLWRLRDDEAAALFEAFYRHIASGRSVADAMREAKRDRVLSGAAASAWAGVLVLGDGTAIPCPVVPDRPSSRVFPAALVAALTLVFSAGVVWRLNRRSL